MKNRDDMTIRLTVEQAATLAELFNAMGRCLALNDSGEPDTLSLTDIHKFSEEGLVTLETAAETHGAE